MVMTTIEKRRTKIQREPRREVHRQPAWFAMHDGMTRRECVVLDVSPGGAKIMTDAAIDVSDRLELALVPTRQTRQPCEVVWRRGNVYGIRFLF
jgi:PilZ domain